MWGDTESCRFQSGVLSLQQNTQRLHILQQASCIRPQKCSRENVKMQLKTNWHFYKSEWDFYKIQKKYRNRFPRLKVQKFRLNEIWSVDLADMQKLSRYNHRINLISVAVDTLTHFLWALPLRKKTASESKSHGSPSRAKKKQFNGNDETEVLSAQFRDWA